MYIQVIRELLFLAHVVNFTAMIHAINEMLSFFLSLMEIRYSMFLFFLIPVGILLFLYVSMGIALYRAGVPGTNGPHTSGSIHGGNAARRDASKKQIIRMLGELKMVKLFWNILLIRLILICND